MPAAKPGDTVKVHYVGKLDDGAVFHQTPADEPIHFTIGDHEIIRGFEDALIGMNPGEHKTIRIPASEAYGPHHRGLVKVVPRAQLPAEMNPRIGQAVQIQKSNGESIPFRIVRISDTQIMLDGNHPLAGKDLTYEITFLDFSTIKTLTYAQFKKLGEQDSYYKEDRWTYFKKVIDIVNNLEFNRVLELGAYKQPLVYGADVMDVSPNFPNLAYQHNATEIPWPIEDQAYDLFIALQVWEHLQGKQVEAFNEVRRIARMAILSFPLNWYCPGNCHHGITEEIIAGWTHHIPPVKKIQVGIRIIYFFRFD